MSPSSLQIDRAEVPLYVRDPFPTSLRREAEV
jgi:hypothetical protein